MKMNCTQFEGLITFYMDGELSEALKQSFREHLNECQQCNMKYHIIKNIITDIKLAYSRMVKNECEQEESALLTESVTESPEKVSPHELSAYIDNELPDEYNIKIRRDIIAKPSLRKKLENMYKLRKMISESYVEGKNSLRTDYSKDIVRALNNKVSREVYVHCTAFIFIVLLFAILSLWAIIRIV